MLVPLAIPPGIVKNGTPYQRKGRWEDSNLVRWHDGAIRAVGGWLRRTTSAGAPIPALYADQSAEAVRDMFVWRDLLTRQHIVLGSNLTLYHVSAEGVVTTITPAGANTSAKDAVALVGYGVGSYGAGAYGVSSATGGEPVSPPQRWVFDTYGELLLIQQRGFGPLYELDPNTLAVTAVVNAPADSQDILVTEQRIVMTVGAAGDERLVSWSDQENRTVWTPAVSNQAGSFTLQGQGKLLAAISVLQQVLIVGERDAATARYIGPPYVFSFDLAGRNCGVVSSEALVGTDRFAVWWGTDQFWLFDGSVKALSCDVIDFLNTDIDVEQASKITAVTNHQFSEVWWLYQSLASTEVDSYVAWNYRDNTWWTGRLTRTSGLDVGVLTTTLMITPDGLLFNHELLGVLVDGDTFIESAGIDVANGERNSAVRYIYPDTEAFGDVSVIIKGRQFPTGPEFTYGPYTYNNPTPVRAMGRELKFRFTGLTATFELGTPRLDLAPLKGGVR